ncbi:MAG: hypothetical protein QF712_06425 [Candidatus Marinimicrobia bacterium]|nr:hypothetical protein [Candidatus Neomarinimicrobiota bacterium]
MTERQRTGERFFIGSLSLGGHFLLLDSTGAAVNDETESCGGRRFLLARGSHHRPDQKE